MKEKEHGSGRAEAAGGQVPRQTWFGGSEVLDEMFEAVPQGVLAVDAGESVIRINQNGCRIFGYAREEIIGHGLGLLIPEIFRKPHIQHVAGFFRDPKRRMMGHGAGELWGRRKDGTEFPVEVGLSSVVIDDTRLALAFVSDVSERHRSQAQLRQSRERLQQLARQLSNVAEEESRRWARELHDVYSQRLVGVAMELAREASDSALSDRLEPIESQVRSLAEDIHRLSRSMHPNILHDLGLEAALKSETAAFERENGIPTEFQRLDVPVQLPADVALCFYRVVQESLRNIRKHSGADSVKVAFEGSATGLTMTVEDLGNGFDLDRALRSGGLGLISMEERVLAVGGEFSVDSTPGQGTTVRVRVPMTPA